MAIYSIRTNREQEAGLNFVYEKYKTEGQTKEQFLQERCNLQVLNPMFLEFKRSQSMSLDASIATIPEANEAKANQEIQDVITSNGGTIIVAGDTNPIPPPIVNPTPNIIGRTIQTPRGTTSNPIQVGGTDKRTPDASGPDGGGDN
jgi:hypothetical protein